MGLERGFSASPQLSQGLVLDLRESRTAFVSHQARPTVPHSSVLDKRGSRKGFSDASAVVVSDLREATTHFSTNTQSTR